MVARGHNASEVIFNYSLRKINAFYESGMKNRDHENKLLGIAMRYGTSANAREFERWVKGK